MKVFKEMKRKNRGNMLVLSGVFVMVNAFCLLVASSFGGLYFVHNRLQSTADELALLGSTKLNAEDRIGQMNNMIARSRQMVFDADSADTEAHENLNHLNMIADQLRSESRDGALLLEQERQKLSTVCNQEAAALVTSRFNSIKQAQAITLPWLRVSEPTVEISFGRVNAVQSNVGELTEIQELDNNDKAQYVSSDGSKLYKNNIDAKLSGPDSDLTFKLSSLPAPVQKTISPARAVLASKFHPATDNHISSAIQVRLKQAVATGIGPASSSTLQSNGTAETVGGRPMI